MGEILLLAKIPNMGLLYLPLACFLAGAVALIPYREYRSIERFRFSQQPCPAPEILASSLQRLQPQFRPVALVPLGLAVGASILLLLVASSSWRDRIVPLGMIFISVVFSFRLLKERRIVASYTPILARIVEFHRTGRSRVAIYEYESSVGVARGQASSLRGFQAGMTVPVLYNVFKPNESLAVPDFLFYRIRSQPL